MPGRAVLQTWPSSGAPILKPCEFAVKGAPSGRVYDGASATLERRPRQGFRGAYRRDGQVRGLPDPLPEGKELNLLTILRIQAIQGTLHPTGALEASLRIYFLPDGDNKQTALPGR